MDMGETLDVSAVHEDETHYHLSISRSQQHLVGLGFWSLGVDAPPPSSLRPPLEKGAKDATTLSSIKETSPTSSPRRRRGQLVPVVQLAPSRGTRSFLTGLLLCHMISCAGACVLLSFVVTAFAPAYPQLHTGFDGSSVHARRRSWDASRSSMIVSALSAFPGWTPHSPLDPLSEGLLSQMGRTLGFGENLPAPSAVGAAGMATSTPIPQPASAWTSEVQAAIGQAASALEESRRVVSVQLRPLEGEPGALQRLACKPPRGPVALAGFAAAAARAITYAPTTAPCELSEMDAEEGPGVAAATAASAASGDTVGFDVDLSTRCAELSQLAYLSSERKAPGDEERITAQVIEVLENRKLTLVSEVYDEEHDGYAMVVRNDTDVFVAFRGSCNLKNLLTDLDYLPDAKTMSSFAREASLDLPADAQVHRGFLEAWRGLRDPILRSVRSLLEEVPSGRNNRGLALHVTGHSMGGAVGLLASLELAQLPRTHGRCPFSAHSTYTFAAPRLGNAPFADFFHETFPRSTDHWALQVHSDAVPHLPFAAWGFEHPEGVIKIGSQQSGATAWDSDLAARPPLRRSRDCGDSVDMLRPRGGKIKNWGRVHDIEVYLAELRQVANQMAQVEVKVERWSWQRWRARWGGGRWGGGRRGARLDWGV